MAAAHKGEGSLMMRTCFCGLLWGASAGVVIAPHIENRHAEARRAADSSQATHHASIRVKTSRVELVGEQVVGGGVIYDTTKLAISGGSGEQLPQVVEHVRRAGFYNIQPFAAGYNDDHPLLWDRLTTSHQIIDVCADAAFGVPQGGSMYVGRATYDSLKYGFSDGVVFANQAADRIIKDRVEVEFSVALEPGS